MLAALAGLAAAGCNGSPLIVAQMTAACGCRPDQVCGSEGQCVRRAVQVSAGLAYACAVLEGGKLKCWGENQVGQLGLGDTALRVYPDAMGENLPPVDLGRGRSVVSVAAGGFLGVPDSHACAILDDGKLKCWGENSFGKLGLGDTEIRGDQPGEMGDSLPAVDLGTGRKALAVVAGPSHTCALLDTHQVKCWGDNSYGQLGLGDTENRGDQPGEMGDALPAVDLGPGRKASGLALAFGSTCALLDGGAVKCWGGNADGQLGQGDQQTRGDQPGEMGDALPAIDLGQGRTAVQIAAAQWKNCALLDNGQIKCWGNNENGQLGLGDTASRGDQPGEMGDALPAIDLGAGRSALSVAAAFISTCALLDTHEVKCWGDNGHGELGVGDTGNRGDQPGEMGDALPVVNLGSNASVQSITAGTEAQCALLETGVVKCWGVDVTPRPDVSDPVGNSPADMGDALPTIDFGP